MRSLLGVLIGIESHAWSWFHILNFIYFHFIFIFKVYFYIFFRNDQSLKITLYHNIIFFYRKSKNIICY